MACCSDGSNQITLEQPDFANVSPSSTVIKIIILGDSGVGKTSFISRYRSDVFTEHYKATIGADFCTKDVTVSFTRKDSKTGREETLKKEVTLQIWDTAGQERFKSLGIAFYRGSDACILMYDVNEKTTFNNLEKWKEEFLNQSGIEGDDEISKFPFLVVANKVDVEEDGVVSSSGNNVVNKKKKRDKEWRGVQVIESSAKDGRGVKEAFELIAKRVVEREEAEKRGRLSEVNRKNG